MKKKIFDFLEQYYFYIILFVVFLVAIFFISKKFIYESGQYSIVGYDKFQKLQMCTLDKRVIDISNKDGITSINLYSKSFQAKEDIINFSDDLKIKCSYQFSNNEWYIKKQNIKLCTKDEAIKDISYFIEIINKNLKEQENIEKSWEKK